MVLIGKIIKRSLIWCNFFSLKNLVYKRYKRLKIMGGNMREKILNLFLSSFFPKITQFNLGFYVYLFFLIKKGNSSKTLKSFNYDATWHSQGEVEASIARHARIYV